VGTIVGVEVEVGVGVGLGVSVGVGVGVGLGVGVGIGVDVGVGVGVGAKIVWGTGARTIVSSFWERSPPRSERSAYKRNPRLGAAVGVGRERGEAALGISTLLTRVAETASRMTIKWEMKR